MDEGELSIAVDEDYFTLAHIQLIETAYRHNKAGLPDVKIYFQKQEAPTKGLRPCNYRIYTVGPPFSVDDPTE